MYGENPKNGGLSMQQSKYKSTTELKYLARTQMRGRFGILIAASFIPILILFFAIGMVSVSNYIVNYALTFVTHIILSVLEVGASLIFIKCACNMPAQAGDVFYGYKNNTAVALKLGLLFIFIESACAIPCEIMILNSPELIVPNITDTMTISELMEKYPMFYEYTLKYSGLSILCSILAFLVELVFVPAYYLMLDFPRWNTRAVLKKSIEIMRGNKLRYILLQISFVPEMILSLFTCGIGFIWLLPYMGLASANFYLDIMAARNKGL